MGGSLGPEADHRRHVREPHAWGPRVFVFGLWAILLGVQFLSVANYAVNFPYWDDWFNVPFMTGKEPITLGWLWDQTPGAETRTPLYRFLFVALFKAGGDDLRTLQYVNVLLLGVVALAMVRAASALRGRLSYTDAFFPCLLLHWGQAEMYLWCTMLYITVPLALVATWLILVARTRRRLTSRTALLAGVSLLVLPLCGTSGLAFVPPAALWLTWGAFQARRFGHLQAARIALGFVGTAALLTVGFFLGDYERGVPADQSRMDQVTGALKVLAMTLGPAARAFWPHSGWVVVGVLLAALLSLAHAIRRDPSEVFRAGGLALLLMAGAGLALLLGWKRPEQWCLIVYYGTLPLVGLCVAYFTWCLHGSPPARDFLQMGLLGLAGGALSLNSHEGYQASWTRRETLAGVEQEIRAGRPLSILTMQHAATVFWNPTGDETIRVFHRKFHESLQELRAAQVGVFAGVKDDDPHREVRLRLKPAGTEKLTWQKDTARGEGAGSWVTFALPKLDWVSGVRIRYQHSNSKHGPAYYRYSPGLTPYFLVEWRKAGHAEFDRTNRYLDVENNVGPDAEQTVTIWVHAPIDQLRIRPDRQPFECRLAEITLLVPE